MIASAWTRDLRTGAVTRHEVLQPGVYGRLVARGCSGAVTDGVDTLPQWKRDVDAGLQVIGWRLVDVPGGCTIETE